MNDVAITLAERINAAHQAARDTARSAIEHASECGRLLAEAKDQIGHGGWLPWVEANLSFGDRQARKYMRLAAHAGEIANRTSNSDLTIDDALALLAAPKPKQQGPEPGSWEWCDDQVKGPFSAWAVTASDADWLRAKLLHYAAISPVANVCVQAQIEHEPPILRRAVADAAVRRLVKIAGIGPTTHWRRMEQALALGCG